MSKGIVGAVPGRPGTYVRADGSTFELSSWAPRIVIATTGTVIAPPTEHHEWVIAGVLVIPDDVMPHNTELLLRMLRGKTPSEIVYRAPVESLVERWRRLVLIENFADVRGTAKLLRATARGLPWDNPIETLRNLGAAMNLASQGWLAFYRSLPCGDIKIPVVVHGNGMALMLDHRELVLGGPGAHVGAPLRVELFLLEKTPCDVMSDDLVRLVESQSGWWGLHSVEHDGEC